MYYWCFLQMNRGMFCFFFFQAEDGIRDVAVTGVQTCALPISFFRAASARGRPACSPEILVIHKDSGVVRTCRRRGYRFALPHLIGRSRIERLERSEEHTSELQSRLHLVCRLLLEKKKITVPSASSRY